MAVNIENLLTMLDKIQAEKLKSNALIDINELMPIKITDESVFKSSFNNNYVLRNSETVIYFSESYSKIFSYNKKLNEQKERNTYYIDWVRKDENKNLI